MLQLAASYQFSAFSLAHMAVTAKDPDELPKKPIVETIAVLADDMLKTGPTETWDAATVAALEVIRDTWPELTGGRKEAGK